MQTCTFILKNMLNVLAISYEAEHYLTIRSSNCTPWYVLKGVEKLCAPPKKKPQTQMFIEALFIIVETWKKIRCFSKGELITCSALTL